MEKRIEIIKRKIARWENKLEQNTKKHITPIYEKLGDCKNELLNLQCKKLLS